MIENLVVQCREEFCEAHVLLRCDLFQRVPERHLQADRRTMAPDAQRSGLGFVVALRLTREQMAHGFLSSGYLFFKNHIPGRAASQSWRHDAMPPVRPYDAGIESQYLQCDSLF